ncbi:NAD-dependent epimerase/dehydratase family protein [uncultured Sulfitobacter sp.]|uniref:NAD-dependent epimerase/dehydratase family protein n=1 Tax=uncultured Sulfitobacter sp. TaxID=191468 RepID=UPI0026032204|nr:NAD-dependent epimerase/dehydratase family protein [uncultured Sulfitobacter sp.]
MTQTVLILGAKGRFGRAATQAFANAGWNVRALSRAGDGAPLAGVSHVACDVMKRDALVAAARGVDVIVHAVHPAYQHWTKQMPIHTRNVIAAGRASGATVMVVGNVYPFGENAPELLSESGTFAPTTRKGALRVTMEQAFADAAEQGLRSVVLRGGDFIEKTKTGNWFETYITNKVGKGIFTYPGRMDAVHAWAYLPDMARAMVGLAEKRGALPPFASFGFEGYSLTGAELKAVVERQVGQSLKTASFPWSLMRIIGLFSPLIREVNEMRYLWDTPHRVDGSALAAALPDFTPTPLSTAIAEVLGTAPETLVDQAASAMRSA